MPRKPSCQEIADYYIKTKTSGAQSPDQATVNRTIKASQNPALKLLWKSITDITFVCDYKRKRRRAMPSVRKETDAEYLETMFGQTAPEPPGSGFHAV